MKVKRFRVNFPWTTAGWFWLGLATLYALYEIVKKLDGDSDFIVFMALLFIVANIISWVASNEGKGSIEG